MSGFTITPRLASPGEGRDAASHTSDTAEQVAVKGSQNHGLTRDDRIAILEEITRDENVHPRERIAAIRLLEEMRPGEQPRCRTFRTTVEDGTRS